MMGAPGPKMTAMPDRKGLLGDIAKGKQLKKAVTSKEQQVPQIQRLLTYKTTGVRQQ